jgi:hypothetical protein
MICLTVLGTHHHVSARDLWQSLGLVHGTYDNEYGYPGTINPGTKNQSFYCSSKKLLKNRGPRILSEKLKKK